MSCFFLWSVFAVLLLPEHPVTDAIIFPQKFAQFDENTTYMQPFKIGLTSFKRAVRI